MTRLSTVQSVGDMMLEHEILSPFGRQILRNDFEGDVSTYEFGQQEKMVRICLYMSLIFNMTLLFGGWVQDHQEHAHLFDDLKKFAIDCEANLPSYLSHLETDYLEKYHGAKTGLFTKNIFEIDQVLPLHPNEQACLDAMNNSKEAK